MQASEIKQQIKPIKNEEQKRIWLALQWIKQYSSK